MKTHVIRLESHDDVTSIRDKMAWSRATRILLAFPKRRPPNLGLVDLKLILRQAGQLGGQLALVSRERELISDARNLSIPVFSSIAEAQRTPWTLPRRKVGALQQAHRRAEQPASKDVPRTAPVQSMPAWARIAGFILGLTGFFGLILFFVPTATISVLPRRIEQELTMKFWANQAVPAAMANGGMPARLQTIVVEGSQESVGSQETTIAGETATGWLQVTNLTESPVEVPAGAVFLTVSEPEVRFSAQRTVILPAGAGQTAEVPIQALTAGSPGNVPAEAIQAVEGVLGLAISAINPEPIGGGSDRNARAGSEQDYEQLYDSLYTRLAESALQQMETIAGEPQMLVRSSLKLNKVLKNERTPPAGQPADHIRLDLRLEFSALTVVTKDVESTAQMALDVSLPPGYLPLAGGINIINLGEPELDAGGTVRWEGKVTRTIAATWHPQEILPKVAGLPVSQAVSQIADQLDLAVDPEITLFPAWWGRLPFVSFRMKMVEK